MKRPLLLRFIQGLSFAIIITGCNLVNPDEGSGDKITYAEPHQVATQVIAPSGGRVTLDSSGGTVAGLTIDVPNGAYAEGRTFTLSTAPVDGFNLGEDVQFATPIIRIDNGGGYADKAMTVDIPVTIPSDKLAMVIAYDKATGRIEPLPVVDYDSTHIKVATRHFAFGDIASLQKRSGTAYEPSLADMAVILTTLNKLTAGEYPSGFVPGVDDWEFANWGSAVTTGGNCSGMTTTALYYYGTRKPLTGKGLWGRFDTLSGDNTDRIWEDNVKGIRLASTVQSQTAWSSLIYQTFRDASARITPVITYGLFAFAIKVTGQPQYVSVSQQSNPGGGHAMIVYKAKGGSLYVADPNFPGEITNRRIIYFPLDNTFLPYTSGASADNTEINYDIIRFMAQSAIVDWQQLHDTYRLMLDGTVGNGIFPSDDAVKFELLDTTGEWVRPVTGRTFVTSRDSLRFRVNSPHKVLSVWTPAQVESSKRYGDAVALIEGQQKLGFYITNGVGKWIDFKWVTVDRKLSQQTEGCITTIRVDDIPVNLTPCVENSGSPCIYYNSGEGFGFGAQWQREGTTNDNYLYLYYYGQQGVQFPGVGSYNISKDGTNIQIGANLINPATDRYEIKTGTLTSTRFDSRVEGSFSFTAMNLQSKSISVTCSFSCDKK
jgi:hypothetical protein